MRVHDDLVQLGDPDHEDLGELLLDRLLVGTLRALVEPVDLLGADERAAIEGSAGTHLTVIDADGEPRCNLRVERVVTGTWGVPHPEMVAGEGYGDDVAAWRRANEASLRGALESAGGDLTAGTELIGQLITVVETAG